MARALCIEFPGAVYYVTSRGDRREPISVGDTDRLALLVVLGSGLDRFASSARVWCLMDNHYHFVIQTRLANLSLLMRHITSVCEKGPLAEQSVQHLPTQQLRKVHRAELHRFARVVVRPVELFHTHRFLAFSHRQHKAGGLC